jgi:hypothetical protein
MGHLLEKEVEYWYKENNLRYSDICIHYDIRHEVKRIIGKPGVTITKTAILLKVIINM